VADAFAARVDAKDVERWLRDLEQRGLNLSPTMAIIAQSLVSAVDDEFESEGQGEWDGLEKSTLASRRGEGAQILQDLGIFAGDIHGTSGRDFAEANTDTEYAIHHVFGAPKANVPQRNPFDIPDSVLDDGVDLILSAIAG
jgi:phage gpG-like protein